MSRDSHATCEGVVRYLMSLGKELSGRQEAAELAIRSMGITFTVYSEAANIDRAWPFDVIPRVISTQEWTGHLRRTDPASHRAQPVRRRPVWRRPRLWPTACSRRSVLATSVNFRPECDGMRPPQGVWAHICGSDLVRDTDGTMYVLEDNLRVPSGVSYMLENRQVTKRVFADLFRDLDIHPVDSYPNRLAALLAALSPRPGETPVMAVLTPGIFNSAYFEHSSLAQQMGAPPGRGQRPCRRRRRLRLSAHRRRPRPRRRHLPACRRPLPRPRGLPFRLHPRRPRVDARVACRKRAHSPTRRASASPTTRSSTPSCPRSSATTWMRTR